MMRLYGSYIMSGLKTIDANYNIKSHVVFYLNKEQRRQNLEAHCFFIPTAFFSMKRDVPKTSLPSPVRE